MKAHVKERKNFLLFFAFVSVMFSANPVWAALDPFDQVENVEVVAKGADSPVKFTAGLGAGYLSGDATELVYWPEAGNHKASELTWEIDNLFMFNVNAEISIHDWVKVKLDTWFKVTDGEGTLDDYDWQIVGGDWTDWSHHEDTDVSEAYMVDLSGEFAFYRSENAAFSAILGYKADHFGWEARGGDYIYSVSGFRNSQGSFPDGLTGISYDQTYYSFYLGVGTELQFSKFKTEARLIYAPYVYGEATDNHHLRNLVTHETFDEFGDGNLLAIDISGSYFFTEQFSLGIGLRYQSYSTMTGDADWHYRNYGVVVSTDDGVGMDQTSTMIVTMLKYTF